MADTDESIGNGDELAGNLSRMMEVLIQLNEQRHHARAAKLSDATALLMVNAREPADNATEPTGNAYDDLPELVSGYDDLPELEAEPGKFRIFLRISRF